MAVDKHRRPTLRDVAREADVSVWTASNTFNNPARVAQATRERVLTAADALGYAGPNPGARTLALGRSNLVALVTDGEADRLLSDATAALLAQGVLTTCSRAGLSLVLAGHGSEPLADGRIMVAGTPNMATRGPLVVAGAAGGPGIPSVQADLSAGAASLCALLRELGHRHIAILSTGADGERLAQIEPHLRGAGPLAVMQSGDGSTWPSRPAGESAARQALAARPRPTALLALHDTLALGAFDAAHRLGLHVPRDLTIVGIDDTPGADTLGLTTVLVPYRPMGELAGELLVRQLEGERIDHDPPRLPSALVLRTSAAPPRPAP